MNFNTREAGKSMEHSLLERKRTAAAWKKWKVEKNGEQCVLGRKYEMKLRTACANGMRENCSRQVYG